MTNELTHPARWAQRPRVDASASWTRDVTALGIDLAQGRACRGRWFAVACRARALDRLLTARFISTVAIAVAAFTAMAALA